MHGPVRHTFEWRNNMKNFIIKKAFTLIELLIVIAIIAIIAAIIFPVFARVREKARQASCSSNMRQLGLGFLQYTQDYDENYPAGSQGFLGQGWAGIIYPYVKSAGVYKCPDDSTAPRKNGNVISYPVSYAGNLNILRPDGSGAPDDPQAGLSLASLTSPVKTVLLCEVQGIYAPVTDPLERNGANGMASSVTRGSEGGSVYPYANSTIGEGQLATGCLGGEDCRPVGSGPGNTGFAAKLGRHTNGSNYAMADGHVKWLRGSQVSSGPTAPTEDCNPDGSPALPDCVLPPDTSGMAAGTGNSRFTVTFSTR